MFWSYFVLSSAYLYFFFPYSIWSNFFLRNSFFFFIFLLSSSTEVPLVEIRIHCIPSREIKPLTHSTERAPLAQTIFIWESGSSSVRTNPSMPLHREPRWKCNGYHGKDYWTRLLAFHITLKSFEKVSIQLFYFCNE